MQASWSVFIKQVFATRLGFWVIISVGILILLLAVGYREESVQIQKEIVDATGSNKLVLYNLVQRSPFSAKEYHEFHSLVWRVKEGTNWTDKWITTKKAVEWRNPLRSVSDIAGFDTTNGTAILKIIDEPTAFTNGVWQVINIIYSWREWDMIRNGEVRTLRICKSPLKNSKKTL